MRYHKDVGDIVDESGDDYSTNEDVGLLHDRYEDGYARPGVDRAPVIDASRTCRHEHRKLITSNSSDDGSIVDNIVSTSAEGCIDGESVS
jgi:hypothetical protein